MEYFNPRQVSINMLSIGVPTFCAYMRDGSYYQHYETQNDRGSGKYMKY